MKKLLMMVMLAVLCQWGYSQYQPGDYYQEDGLDCMVIKVNEDGKSGLVMTLPGVLPCAPIETDVKIDTGSVKKMMRSAIKQGRKQWKMMQSLLLEREKIVFDLSDELGRYGVKNQDIIKAYCRKEGVDYAYFFPEYAWIDNLGSGWFLPGDEELDYFAAIVNGGTRKMAHKELWNGLLTLNYKMPERDRMVIYDGLFVPYYVNEILFTYIKKMRLSERLRMELEKQMQKADKKVNDRVRGFGSARPFNMGTSIKSSSLFRSTEGFWLKSSGIKSVKVDVTKGSKAAEAVLVVLTGMDGTFSEGGYIWGNRTVSYMEYSHAVLCAVKWVEF